MRKSSGSTALTKCDMSELPESDVESSQLMADSGVICSEPWMLTGSTGDKGRGDLVPKAISCPLTSASSCWVCLREALRLRTSLWSSCTRGQSSWHSTTNVTREVLLACTFIHRRDTYLGHLPNCYQHLWGCSQIDFLVNTDCSAWTRSKADPLTAIILPWTVSHTIMRLKRIIASEKKNVGSSKGGA
jgi:hypothetical protein